MYNGSMAKCVVTGGAGFIGSHLCDVLLAKGYQVCVIDDLSTGRKENIAHIADKIEFIEGSILDPEALKRAFSGAQYIFHLAAVPSVPRSVQEPLATHEANSTGTLRVLLAAKEAGVKRVVYAGSSSYYGDTPTLPKKETMPPNPQSPYALQKYSGEAYAAMFYRLYGLETAVVRYFNVYGPRQNPDSQYAAVIPRFIRAVKKGEAPTVYGDGTTTRDFTYVSDTAAATLAAAEVAAAAGQIFNIAGGVQTSLNQLLDGIQRVVGKPAKPVFEPFRAGDIHDSLADISNAQRILGYKPAVPLEDGLERTVEALQV
jgi:nucleoside-diphosphate-sugar epimerase